MVVKRDLAKTGAEDLIAEAVWPEEGPPTVETFKTTGTEVLLNDATFSEHNLPNYRSTRLKLYETNNHQTKRHQDNTLKRQLSSTSLSDGQRR